MESYLNRQENLTLLRVRTAAYRRAALGELQNSWRTMEKERNRERILIEHQVYFVMCTGQKAKMQQQEVKYRRLTGHSRSQLTSGTVGHVDDGGSCFINHHLMFIPQAALNEVKQRAIVPVKPTCVDRLSQSTLSNCMMLITPKRS